MLSQTAFRITARACEIRVHNGESITDVVLDYPKLSEEQVEILINQFTVAENQEVSE